MTIDKIERILKDIGLDDLEVKCYLELLKKSPQKASDLEKALEISKATILNALYRLSNEVGIIKRAKKKNSYLFLVEDVNDVVKVLERAENKIKKNKEDALALLPEMRAMQNYEITKPKIYYYEGKEGLKKVFEEVLDEAKEIIGYGSNEDEVKYLEKLFPAYYEERVKKKIPVKAIIPATEFNIKDTLENESKFIRKTHLIPKEFNYPIQVNIYGNSSVFYSFEEKFALKINSKPIAACLKKIFEMAFDDAREDDKEIRKSLS